MARLKNASFVNLYNYTNAAINKIMGIVQVI